MAKAALNLAPSALIFASFSRRTRPKAVISIRASSSLPPPQTPDSSSTSVKNKKEEKQGSSSTTSSWTFAPPPNFKLLEPKRFGVRLNKSWEIFGASLAIFFRLGTCIFAFGYG